VVLMTDHELMTIVGTVGNIYGRFGCSPPSDLRRAAQGWRTIPLSEIVRATEDHLTTCRQYYHGSGERWFPLLCQMIDRLRDKHLRVEDAHPKPSPRRAASRTRRPVVTKLYRGPGYVEAFVDDDREVSHPDAPQPFLTREPRGQKVDYVGSLEDDDVEDGAA
jgi:hypothetical protein